MVPSLPPLRSVGTRQDGSCQDFICGGPQGREKAIFDYLLNWRKIFSTEMVICRLRLCCFRGSHDRAAIGTCLDNRVLCGRSDPAAAASVAVCPSGVAALLLRAHSPTEGGREEEESEFQFSPLGTGGRCRHCRVAFAPRGKIYFLRNCARSPIHPFESSDHSYFWEDLQHSE